MNINLFRFAEAETSSGGIGAFGLDLELFIAQLITFVIVLAVLAKFVFPKLSATLEARRRTLEQSLELAKQTEVALQKAQNKADELIKKAREEAGMALREAEKRAQEVIAKAEAGGAERAERIVSEAKAQLEIDKQVLRDELKEELAGLVAAATEVVLSEKIDIEKERRLIERAIKGEKV